MVFTTQEWNDITKKNLQKFIYDKELKMNGMNWTLIFFLNQITTKEPSAILHSKKWLIRSMIRIYYDNSTQNIMRQLKCFKKSASLVHTNICEKTISWKPQKVCCANTRNKHKRWAKFCMATLCHERTPHQSPCTIWTTSNNNAIHKLRSILWTIFIMTFTSIFLFLLKFFNE
jgi:hypothetical protein